ncbi:MULTISPECIES: ABC transporter substrate-binding protein [Microbacterium]|jgi:ABC-type sugar transport system substrate-binding protein|uniref:ABC transporter substrate-binding protein n=1 Tax=Microbacterium TaxID=33882 RepID=UPI000E75CA6D|nr:MULTISPECIES: ABC transporter substrate-binding protein [Microbacterium]RKE59383.1 monosaccharide ABC transporter substrate-binding protein (CUT2 family) [Microbacterium sp. AG238]WJM15257.1 ABC transporter substrate-binding protein [Microbacterium arborescens]
MSQVKSVVTAIAMLGVVALSATACASSGSPGGSGGDDVITVGFAQTGSESGWRSANTESIKEAFSAENGFDLIFNAADNKPEAQIAAVRSFINQGVDAIVLAPIVSDGWDDVLKEAKDAGIPVILEDRTVSAPDDLYASWIGLDFEQEGKTAGEWVAENFGSKPTNLVILEGTTGSSAATDRQTGFDAAVAGTDITVLDSQTGNFTRAEGKTVMEGFLQKFGSEINVLFAHNDDMGLGALDAIKAAGMTPGTDIQIVTIDAVKDGMTALANGEFNFIVECNPLLGEKTAEVVKSVVAGESVDKTYIVEDQSFTQEQAKEVLDSRPY